MKPIKVKLAVIIFVFFFFAPKIIYASTETTLYFTSVEKVLETGEVKVYYSAGNSSAVRSIKGDQTTVSYLHPDWLGSVSLITNDRGLVEGNTIAYYPFGNEVNPLPQNPTDRFYTGQRKDASSNLYFYNARYYNPKTGHFISADYAQGPNRYAYVGNNPIIMNDPTGNSADEASAKSTVKSLLGELDKTYDYYGSQYGDWAGPENWAPSGPGMYPPTRVDPSIVQIKRVAEKISRLTGVEADVWLAIGFRENLLRGNRPQLHGDTDPVVLGPDGIFMPLVRWHTLNEEMRESGNIDYMGREGLMSSFAVEGLKNYASNTPIGFVREDFEANMYAGASIFMYYMGLLKTEDYSQFYNAFHTKGYSDVEINYVMYHMGPQNLSNKYWDWLKKKDPDKLQGILWRTQDTAELFSNTLNINKPWSNPAYCQSQGYCGSLGTIKKLNQGKSETKRYRLSPNGPMAE